MITRIVKMTFREDRIKEFTDLFETRRDTIAGFAGCTHLDLWQDNIQKNIFFTYSKWDSDADLNHYRYSGFFKETWGMAKVLFAAPPEAWSLNEWLGEVKGEK